MTPPPASQGTAGDIRAVNATIGEVKTRAHNCDVNAREIDRIAQAIQDIAEQTNLLVLNAAISARVGPKAVVCCGMMRRKLAERTTQATLKSASCSNHPEKKPSWWSMWLNTPPAAPMPAPPSG